MNCYNDADCMTTVLSVPASMTGSSRLPSPEMTAGMMKKKVMSIACTVHMVSSTHGKVSSTHTVIGPHTAIMECMQAI